MGGDDYDKDWARKYILDPLTAPEPSQESGIAYHRAHPHQQSSNTSPPRDPSPPQSPPKKRHFFTNAFGFRSKDNNNSNSNDNPRENTQRRHPEPAAAPRRTSPSATSPSLPTPPTSAASSRDSFHPSNPFAEPRDDDKSAATKSATKFDVDSPTSPAPPPYSEVSLPIRTKGQHLRASSNPEGPTPPRRRSPPQSNQFHAASHIARANSQATPRRSNNYNNAGGSSSLSVPHHPSHRRARSTPAFDHPNSNYNYNNQLLERYPGDMSHRPLDTIKRDVRAAERTHRRGASSHGTDIIDSLDTIGGTYHHGGPYDATLASRNVHPKYSPVAAVKHSNEEAIKATPREFIQDSLQHRVPLQGTAVIPPGGVGPGGRVMEYEEGADLMREPDAEGGAYKRWDGVRYLPEDLKGKGEPSFTYERDQKAKERLLGPAGEYELQSPRRSSNRRSANNSNRQRASSNVGEDESFASGSGSLHPDAGHGHGGGIQRSNTTGKRLSDGLKRRMGSLRKKQDMPSQGVA